MPEIAKSAHAMISGMTPEPRPGVFVFATTGEPAVVEALSGQAIARFAEAEGVSMILPVESARAAGFDVSQPMTCITLNVYSALGGVGLTAAVAGALGESGIPCNMVAAFHHDHVFVPEPMGARALAVLMALQAEAAEPG